LSEAAPFSSLNEQRIREIARSSELLAYNPKEFVLREEEMTSGFFFILDGQVEVQRRGVPIRRMGRGQFFGETGLIKGEPRTADVVAVQPTACLKIGERVLRELMEANPQVASGLLEELIRRNIVTGRVSAADSELKFEFKSESAKKAFEKLVDAFIHDYMVKKIVAERCGWRSSTEVARDTGLSLQVFYGRHGRIGSAIKESIRRGVIETRFFPGERGRGGEVMRFRVAYEKEPVRAYLNQRIRTGTKASRA
jgi:CRP-like cAMP-binding protein